MSTPPIDARVRVLPIELGGPRTGLLSVLAALLTIAPCADAPAGPPYVTDDPGMSEQGRFEIYAYTQGAEGLGATLGATGIDASYSITNDVQVTAVVPVDYDAPDRGPGRAGLGNVEFASKIRFLHQDQVGVDVAILPRLFAPIGDRAFSDPHPWGFLPVWAERDWRDWSLFGGGGCSVGRHGHERNFCLTGIALARQVRPDLQLGAEIVHQTPAHDGDRPQTAVNLGFVYDLNATFHLVGSVGPTLQNEERTSRFSWYLALFSTF